LQFVSRLNKKAVLAIAARTGRCRCKFRYVSKVTAIVYLFSLFGIHLGVACFNTDSCRPIVWYIQEVFLLQYTTSVYSSIGVLFSVVEMHYIYALFCIMLFYNFSTLRNHCV